MWKIKYPEIKQKTNQFFTDKEIDIACAKQMHDGTDQILLSKGLAKKSNSTSIIEITIPKNEFEIVYNPNGWNPYPTVRPPVDGEKWLTQDEDGNLDIRSFVRTFEEGIDYSWENQDDILIVAFRSLPPLYTRDEQIDN